MGLPMDARRKRFLDWYAAHYKPGADGRAAFMQKTKLTKGRVTQLFNEKEPFGERAAVALAGRLGLPDDAFLKDRPSQSPPPPPPSNFADARVVSESDWALLQDVLTAATEDELKEIRQRAALINGRVQDIVRRMNEATKEQAEAPAPQGSAKKRGAR